MNQLVSLIQGLINSSILVLFKSSKDHSECKLGSVMCSPEAKSFNPILKLHLDMLAQSKRVFQTELPEESSEDIIEICEISTNNLLRDGHMDHADFLDRADAIQALGKTVLISRSAEFYRLTTYLSHCTTQAIAIVLSIGLLNELFKEKWSQDLEGGIDMTIHFPDEAGFNDGTQVIPDSDQLKFGI